VPAESSKSQVKPAQRRKTKFQVHFETKQISPFQSQGSTPGYIYYAAATWGAVRRKHVGRVSISPTSASERMNLGTGKRNMSSKLRWFAIGIGYLSVQHETREPIPQQEIDCTFKECVHGSKSRTRQDFEPLSWSAEVAGCSFTLTYIVDSWTRGLVRAGAECNRRTSSDQGSRSLTIPACRRMVRYEILRDPVSKAAIMVNFVSLGHIRMPRRSALLDPQPTLDGEIQHS
jgi:hypothetical protein